MGQARRILAQRGVSAVVGGGSFHSISGGIIRFLDEPVVSVTENCLDCTIRSLDNMLDLLGRSVNRGGAKYASLTSHLETGGSALMGDLIELIEENAAKSGRAYRRMTFAKAARQNKPFIAVVATDVPDHMHSIVVERVYQYGGQKVAKVIDSEHNLKYIIGYNDLEVLAKDYERVWGGGAGLVVR